MTLRSWFLVLMISAVGCNSSPSSEEAPTADSGPKSFFADDGAVGSSGDAGHSVGGENHMPGSTNDGGPDVDDGSDQDGPAVADPDDSQPAVQDDDLNERGDGGFSGPAMVQIGVVSLYQSEATSGGVTVVSSGASAYFGVAPTASTQPTDSGCETAPRGDCVLTVCNLTEQRVPLEDPSEPAADRYLDAGSLSVSGLANNPVFTFDPMSRNYRAATDQLFWQAGELAKIRGGGSDFVPAFEIQLPVPSSVRITRPVMDAMVSVDVPRTMDFDVTWEEGSIGTMELLLIDASNPLESRIVACRVPAAEGALTIEPSLLAALGEEAYLSGSVLSEATLRVAEWTFNAQAVNGAVIGGQLRFTD